MGLGRTLDRWCGAWRRDAAESLCAAVAIGLLVFALLSCVAHAQSSTDMNTAAQQSSAAVSSSFGSPASMNAGLAQPMNSPSTMKTVDGSQSFTTSVSCPASTQYLQINMGIASTGDIAGLTLQWNPNFGPSYTKTIAIPGEVSGVCNNGVIECNPGTFTNCNYYQWQATASSIGLLQVPQQSLGACFCINNYCGSHLVTNNSAKVLSDLGGGITLALQTAMPRLGIAPATITSNQATYYGNASGCNASGPLPESFYNSSTTTQMGSAGQAIASDPTSEYNQVLNSPAAQGQTGSIASCQLNRVVTIASISKTQVIQTLSATNSLTSDCGAGCLDVQLGKTGDNYWNGNGCTLYSDQELLQVTGGAYVTSATLTDVDEDDFLQLQINGVPVWANPSTWLDPNNPVSNSCETSRHATFHPNLDLTSYFNQDGKETVTNHVSVGGGGEGWSIIRFMVNEGCFLTSDSVADGCTGMESQSSCQLESEVVDGVQTVQNFMPTGLSPLPSTHTISTPCSYGPVTEPFWNTQRTYLCNAGNTSYDFSDAVARYNTVTSSLNPSSGSYTDRTVTQAGGTPSYSNGEVTLPPPQSTACFQQCETATSTIGPAVGDQSGPVSTLNPGTSQQAYSFKECTPEGTCPVGAGETIVSNCACTNDFNKAASSMQLMRMMSEDAICTP